MTLRKILPVALFVTAPACLDSEADPFDLEAPSDLDGADDGLETDGTSEPSDPRGDPSVPFGRDEPALEAAGDPYDIALPFRRDDLELMEMWEISQVHAGSSTSCYGNGCAVDIHAIRWDGGGVWTLNKVGQAGSAPEAQVGFGKPVYSPTSGRVISCWQNYPDNPDTTQDPTPYDPASDTCLCNESSGTIDCTDPSGAEWQPCPNVMRAGGNAMVVQMSDGLGVALAHFQQGSIPDGLCPNNPTQVFPTNIGSPFGASVPVEYLTCEPGTGSGKGGACEDADRPWVDAGDFLGRVGNSSTGSAHLHLQVSEFDPVSGDNFLQVASRDMMMTSDWHQPRDAAGPAGWIEFGGFFGGDSLVQTLVAYITFGIEPILLWPGDKTQETLTADTRLADFDGDGEDDLLCHSNATGTFWLDFAWGGALNGTNQQVNAGWCKGRTQRLYTGDFNGNGRDDVLCVDVEEGGFWVDYTDASGVFQQDDAFMWAFCHGNEEVHIGDFDNDGIDDLLCHEPNPKKVRTLWRGTPGASTPFTLAPGAITSSPWCYGPNQRLHVGQFDAFAGDDLLCHDVITGDIYIDTGSVGAPHLSGTDDTAGPWCRFGAQRLFIGDFDYGSGRDDILCHDSDTGKIWIDDDVLTFPGTDWSGPETGWCTGPSQRLRVGDINGDGREDLVCFDEKNGRRWIDYADHVNWFEGTDWSSSEAGATKYWCRAREQGVY